MGRGVSASTSVDHNIQAELGENTPIMSSKHLPAADSESVEARRSIGITFNDAKRKAAAKGLDVHAYRRERMGRAHAPDRI
jgi:hypothetical protein